MMRCSIGAERRITMDNLAAMFRWAIYGSVLILVIRAAQARSELQELRSTQAFQAVRLANMSKRIHELEMDRDARNTNPPQTVAP